MSLYIVRDGHYTLKDNKAASNLLHYSVFGKRYLDVFDEVVIVGRLFAKEDPTALPIEGEGVRFEPLPGRRGAIGSVLSLFSVMRLAWRLCQKGNAYILRIPGTIPSIFFFVLLLKRIPFSVEVAADPYDSYSKKALDGHFLSGLVQRFFVWLVRVQCKKADASVYVTSYALQKRYPPGKKDSSYSFTSIDLGEDSYAASAKTFSTDFNQRCARLILIGNMQGSMKGHDVLINAIRVLKDRGRNVVLTIIGYGNNQTQFEKMVSSLGLNDNVIFTGKLPAGEPVRTLLADSDLFVLPSRQEGLPRALLEAMTQGLPAIGTRVGGTPELLDDIALVDPDSISELAARIEYFLSNLDVMNRQAEINFVRARDYSKSVITSKRNSFLEKLKQVSGIDKEISK